MYFTFISGYFNVTINMLLYFNWLIEYQQQSNGFTLNCMPNPYLYLKTGILIFQVNWKDYVFRKEQLRKSSTLEKLEMASMPGLFKENNP